MSIAHIGSAAFLMLGAWTSVSDDDAPEADAVTPPQVPFIGAGAGAVVNERTAQEADSNAPSGAIQKAAEAFLRRDFPAVLNILADAYPMDSADPEIANMRGAALTELRRFDEAMPFFENALKADPGHFWARFNLAELELMRGQPSAARPLFSAMKPTGNTRTDELIDFKIILTFLKEGNLEEAAGHAEAMRFPSDTAAWYAAQAALAFHHGNEEEGISWLDESERIYPGQLSGILLDSLADSGWSVRLNETP